MEGLIRTNRLTLRPQFRGFCPNSGFGVWWFFRQIPQLPITPSISGITMMKNSICSPPASHAFSLGLEIPKNEYGRGRTPRSYSFFGETSNRAVSNYENGGQWNLNR
jgi:hypothetical protein